MGKGKLEKFEEMKKFRHVVQATYKSIDNSDFYLKGKWTEEFFKNQSPIILELGCGKGEYTIGMAKKFPHLNFIGVDIKGARMWKGAKQAIEYNLKNVGFLRTNIESVDQFFFKDEIKEIWITFPDPQMKKPRKRLTATNFLEKYQKFLSCPGIIHLKTDSNFLYQYTYALIKENGFKILAKTKNLYDSVLINEILSIRTFYEDHWINRGIPIKYLSFSIPPNVSFKEPDVNIEKDTYRSYNRNSPG